MYYSDLLSAAENDITSRNFCSLVDAAVMLYQKEISNCHTEMKSKILSVKDEEDERDKRIFHRFSRKTRTLVKTVVTRRNPQRYYQDPSSTCSSRKPSFLLDLNTIPPDDDSDNPQNPNSSSSLLLLDYHSIPADSESTDMTDPRNPKTSRKRRAVEEKKRCGKFKKAKVDTFSWIGRETPELLVQLMNETVSKWGERTDLRLIFQRTLFKTDVNPNDGRLSMPFNELIRSDFLTPVESRAIEHDISNDKKTGIGAIFFDQRNVKWGVMLKRWEMKGTWNYALTCGWNDVVQANGLKLGDDISIWSFRWGGLLCFRLVTPPTSMAQSSSSLALCL